MRVIRLACLLTFFALNAAAETSTRRVSSNLLREYGLIKNVVHELHQKQIKKYKFDFGEVEDDTNIINCNHSDYAVKRGEPDAELIFLASNILEIERIVRRQRYPENVWRDLLQAFEEAVLRQFATQPREKWNASEALGFSGILPAELTELLSSLSNHRKSRSGHLRELFAHGRCGGGEVTLKLETIPPGAKVLLLVEFYYRLCKAQGLDPYDQKECDRWVEISTEFVDVAGDYRFLAVWSDGNRRTGLVQFNRPPQDGEKILIRR